MSRNHGQRRERVETNRASRLWHFYRCRFARLFPFPYEDFHLRRLSDVKDGDKVTVEGRIMSQPVLQRYGRKSRLTCRVLVEEWLVTATWFNRPYLREQLEQGGI